MKNKDSTIYDFVDRCIKNILQVDFIMKYYVNNLTLLFILKQIELKVCIKAHNIQTQLAGVALKINSEKL